MDYSYEGIVAVDQDGFGDSLQSRGAKDFWVNIANVVGPPY